MRWIKGNKSLVNLEDVCGFVIEKSGDDIAISAILRCLPDALIRINSGFMCEEAAISWISKKLND